MELNTGRFERIIFLEGSAADVALALYTRKGSRAAMDHLSQWHYPGEHETSDRPAGGRADDACYRDGYILTANECLGYIGLEYDTTHDHEKGASV